MPRALFVIAAVFAQAAAPADLDAVIWDAVQPALAFPAATERHEPVDGSTTARWMVRRARPDEGSLVAEVLANPLNRDAQTRAVEDMAAIQQEVFAAERRAQVEFERAREQARQSGAPIPVRGVTLDDEGVAGERADANERMTIEWEMRSTEHLVRIDAADAPVITDHLRGAVWIVRVPGRELPRVAESRAQYYPAQAIVYFASARPTVSETARHAFTVRATAQNVVAVILRGNSDLIDQVIAKADWPRVADKTRPTP